MQESLKVDETDLALVSAMSLQPRATWAVLGASIGVDPATAARHWERLSDARAAWVTAFPLFAPRSVAAMLDMRCSPMEIPTVLEHLVADPRIVLLATTTGERQMLATAVTEDWPAMSRFVLDTVHRVPGVRDVGVYPIQSHFASAQTRSNGLDRHARESLALTRRLIALSEYRPDDLDWAICEVLTENGRAPATAIATAVGASEATVRRRVDNLISTGCLRLRCDVANALNPHPWDAWFFAELPAHRLSSIGHLLGTLPHVFQVTSVTGRHNIVFGVSLSSADQAESLEAQLTERIPDLRIRERKLSLRMVKFFSRRLDESGFATGIVSLDYRDR